jgi:energy-coupling factor transporter ATP-binding protein EcfA2
MPKLKPGPRLIRRIVADDLFGLYRYDVPVGVPGETGAPGLLILYGDNGCGKTTLLRLVRALLTLHTGSRQRAAVTTVPFRQFTVELSDNTTITAVRPSSRITGECSLALEIPGQPTLASRLVVDQTGKQVPISALPIGEQGAWHLFASALSALDVAFFVLTDDRRSGESEHLSRSSEHRLETWEQYSARQHHAETSRKNADLEAVDDAVQRLNSWLRDEVLRATTVGQANTGTIYADIARRISKAKGPGRPSTPKYTDISATLAELEQRSAVFVEWGVIPPPRLAEIANVFSSAQGAAKRTIGEAITPYIDATKARLDALASVRDTLTLLLERMNSFYSNKRVSYNLKEGLTIVAPNEQRLAPTLLSSGERQLLQLFARIASARDRATVFLIDEPEISLNIKWQRQLVDTLLALVGDAPAQFILATHSIELLSTHRENVFALQSSSVGSNDDSAK